MKEMEKDKVANSTTSILKAKAYFDVHPVVCVRKRDMGVGTLGKEVKRVEGSTICHQEEGGDRWR